MANTLIQIKYSSGTSAPTTLNVAELAYSLVSDKLFIGNTTNAVLTIGGKYYTDIIDAATNANTVSTVVKRDASGNFSATTISAALAGNADTASKWQTARNIGVSGDATGIVSVDGTANANIPLTLANSGVAAGTYGGTTNVPTFAVDAKGRITSVSNVAISTSFNAAANTGSGSIAGGSTITIVGGTGGGITTTFTDALDRFDLAVDSTVLRNSGSQSISGDLSVTGNLIVVGSTITQNVSTIVTNDSLIQLANNNIADALDIGFFGQYVNGGTKYTTLFRDATDGNFKLLTAGTEQPLISNTVNVAAFTTATLVANLTGGTVSGLTADIAVADGGTGAGSFTAGGILMGNGTGAISVLANSTTTVTGGLSAANTISAVTVDAYGRLTAYTGAAIAIGAAQITSGTLPIARGGTNQTTFSTGQQIVFDGTSLASRANSTTTVTGGLSAANTITSVTVNSYGELTAYTGAAIAVNASQVTSGTLGVTRGGTGLATYAIGDIVYASGTTTLASLADIATGNVLLSGGVGTAPTYGKVGLTTHVSGTLGVGNGGTGVTTITSNGVLLGQGGSAITTASSSTEGHVLTINASGVPTFVMISGGTF